MGEVGGIGFNGAYMPQGNSNSSNENLQNYNAQAYANAANAIESAQNIINMLEAEHKPGVPSPKMLQAFDQLKQAFSELSQGAPPSLEACNQFQLKGSAFENAVYDVLPKGGITNLLNISNDLTGLEVWTTNGCPKQN